MIAKKSHAKFVRTKDLSNNPNGYLVELAKSGQKTTCYLSVAYPGCFKGYHLHTVREANYVIVRGKAKIILYTLEGKEEHILDSASHDSLHIPINIPTAIENLWSEEAWLVNYPNPAYDPSLKNEQIDFTEEELKNNKHAEFQNPRQLQFFK